MIGRYEICGLLGRGGMGLVYKVRLPVIEKMWNADRRSFNAAWFVSVDLGFVFWQDFTCHYYVRAVCSLR